MKACSFCGTPWVGYGGQPRERERCSTCLRSYRCCSNCHYLDAKKSSSCTFKGTTYVGPRDLLNYCEAFRMTDSFARANENRISSARAKWDQLFSR